MKTLQLALTLCLLFSLPAVAQFDVVNYFSDSVSFSYEQNIVRTKKSKETRVYNKFNFIVRIQDDQLKATQITISDKGVTNADKKIYTLADITTLEFKSPGPKIEENTEVNGQVGKEMVVGSTTPAAVFYLVLKPIFGLSGIETYGESPYPKSSNSIYLYFPSAAAAEEAVKYLAERQKEIVKRNKELSRSFADFVPKSNCGTGARQYVNKTFGFTLCIDDKETVSDLTYEKFNYQFLKDFVLIEGFSDLPFYVCPIVNKTEYDVKALFTKFENEFFDRIGAAHIQNKTLYKDELTKAASPDAKDTHFRGYTITLASGGEANVCFDYMLGASTRFQALCFAYMAPAGTRGLPYTFKNSARIAESKAFIFY